MSRLVLQSVYFSKGLLSWLTYQQEAQEVDQRWIKKEAGSSLGQENS